MGRATITYESALSLKKMDMLFSSDLDGGNMDAHTPLLVLQDKPLEANFPKVFPHYAMTPFKTGTRDATSKLAMVHNSMSMPVQEV